MESLGYATEIMLDQIEAIIRGDYIMKGKYRRERGQQEQE